MEKQMNEIPRRAYIDKLTPAETAIREAVLAVEAMGADVRLTEAVILLGKARDRVADFVDGIT
jgi:predicted RNase H-like nuclease (RuvC/YqgF family)